MIRRNTIAATPPPGCEAQRWRAREVHERGRRSSETRLTSYTPDRLSVDVCLSNQRQFLFSFRQLTTGFAASCCPVELADSDMGDSLSGPGINVSAQSSHIVLEVVIVDSDASHVMGGPATYNSAPVRLQSSDQHAHGYPCWNRTID